jgi:hypothetical protein
MAPCASICKDRGPGQNSSAHSKSNQPRHEVIARNLRIGISRSNERDFRPQKFGLVVFEFPQWRSTRQRDHEAGEAVVSWVKIGLNSARPLGLQSPERQRLEFLCRDWLQFSYGRETLPARQRVETLNKPGAGKGTRTPDPLLEKQVFPHAPATLGSPASTRVSIGTPALVRAALRFSTLLVALTMTIRGSDAGVRLRTT